jgi:hypothetical protein
VLAGNDRRLNRPQGEYRTGAVTGGTTLKVAGRVRTLKVGPVDGSSTLDASALEAREVLLTGKIDHATIKLRAPHGRVEFRAGVGGDSRVDVDAPGGTVVFGEPPREGSKIDGDTRLTVTAREVDFRAAIDGPHTRVVVTLTGGGVLAFRAVGGGSLLHYRKADPNAPNPRVIGGTIDGTARVQKID